MNLKIKKTKFLKKTNAPLISLITVVYNGEKHLEKTIKSVLNQKFKDIEYVIIDGGSNDSSLKIIKKYQNYIDFWISESDRGIYHAMNKGIKYSSGIFVGFVNSDDLIYKDTALKLAKAYKNKKFDYTLGPVDIITNTGILVEKFRVLKNFNHKERYKYRMASAHQGFFINRDYLNKIGLFDESFQYSSDFDMTIRAIRSSKNYFEFEESVGSFRLGGKSNFLTFFENFYIMKKHQVPIIKNIFFTFNSLMKFSILKYSRNNKILNKIYKLYIRIYHNK